jgi:hypothetical protein
MVICGVFWVAAYLLVIKKSFQDETYGIPLPALGLNFSWEFIFTFIIPHGAPYIYTNLLVLPLDTVILLQTLQFGYNEFPRLSKRNFYLMFISTLILGFLIVYLASIILNDQIGFYIAFWQNLLMSILFVLMLKSRDNLRGQSIYIGATKMLGTLFASIAFFIYDPLNQGSPLMSFIYLAILFFDIIYVVLIHKKTNISSLNNDVRL